MYEKPTIDPKYKTENWRVFPGDDRLRCQVCHGIYWRLWEDVAQCMSCRSFTAVEVGGPTGTMHDVKWADFALQTDTRIRDPLTGKSEWIIYRDKLRARTNGQELVLNPPITGTWLAATAPVLPSKVMNSREAIEVIKKSTALRNRKRK